MFRILLILLLFIYNSLFAITNNNNNAFKEFQNQYNIGYGITQGTLINGAHNTVSYGTQYLNLEVEHLFNMGIWLDGNFSMVTNYSQPNLGRLNGGDGSPQPVGQYPFMNAITVKVGYAFQVVGESLQLIPYAMLGRTANWSTSTIISNDSNTLTNVYFYTGGIGGRISYRINNSILLYFDELYTYNWDNSGSIKGVQSSSENYGKSFAATNYTITSTIGAKFNIIKNLQIGINGYWNNYQVQSNIAGVMYTPTNTFGGLLSLGLTY